MKTPLKMFNLKRALFYFFPILLVLAVAIWLPFQFEWQAPTVKIHLDTDHIGARPFNVEVTEKGRGLKRVAITLLAAGKEHPILEENYNGSVKQKDLRVSLSRGALKLKGGPALLRVTATDKSYWNLFKGNTVTVEKRIMIDLVPPRIQVITGDRYINFGGSGLVIYQTSADTVRSGVQVGDHFFRGYKGPLETPQTYLAYFAHPHDAPDKKGILVAEDAAGNVTERELFYSLRNVRIKKKQVKITDRLIETTIIPLLGRGAAQGKSFKELFLAVNRDMRQANYEEIRGVTTQSIDALLWDSPFHQLSNSQVEANFADQRTYTYSGEAIDQAYHLGYDLAVTKNYPIEAANNGEVVFAGDLGIYGNTVIIDHGLGLFTLYGHMSLVSVAKGEAVKRKQIIGRTGQSGLATGDHLHYETLLHGVPVLPLEWWDGKWVNDNVLSKIRFVMGKAPVTFERPQVKKEEDLTVLDTMQPVQRKAEESVATTPSLQAEASKEKAETQAPVGTQ
ncbi:MAG: peptidoglycan DD-metalloendopeptidase family protein [Deltaproteobacteria bacterium]|nr:peptidoglycan DD-metalloendopeptidase family protein [Deltaproteobacteria bacterium]